MTGSTENLDARNAHFAQLDGQRAALFAGDAAGPAVGDVAGRVERAEVAADGHVLRPHLEADAGGLQHPAADQVFYRIVAEKAQVSRSAAGGDARGDRIHASLDAVFCQGVQIGGLRGLQFGRSARLDGQSAQPIGHQHHDFRLIGGFQLADELLDIHVRPPLFSSLGR